MGNTAVPREIRILSVGNSFSVDTMMHLANLARALGAETVHLGNLYVGGCSIRRHAENAEKDLPIYTYYENDGDGWRETKDYSIDAALRGDAWDVVSIQHGTSDGSKYTLPVYYERLPYLVRYVRERVPRKTRIAFNMTWVGEPYHTHPEIVMYGGDQLLIYRRIAALTESLVKTTEGIDVVVPTGTAIQNARTTRLVGEMTRDGYHLSRGIGRFTASIAFLCGTLGVTVESLPWKPDGVSDEDAALALSAVNAAIRTPFAITKIKED